jgi:type IV pilus assembly protein PilX
MKRERGGVLIVALIAMVVLLIGATALLRSTDTANAIAGNAASKQAAVAAADTAIQAAAVYLGSLTPDTAVSNIYYSTQQAVDATTGLFSSSTIWTGPTATTVGNFQVQYLIDRLCDVTPVTDKRTQCAVAPAVADVVSHRVGSPNAALAPIGAVYYRVTARVVGPKSSESYVQAVLSK